MDWLHTFKIEYRYAPITWGLMFAALAVLATVGGKLQFVRTELIGGLSAVLFGGLVIAGMEGIGWRLATDPSRTAVLLRAVANRSADTLIVVCGAVLISGSGIILTFHAAAAGLPLQDATFAQIDVLLGFLLALSDGMVRCSPDDRPVNAAHLSQHWSVNPSSVCAVLDPGAHEPNSGVRGALCADAAVRHSACYSVAGERRVWIPSAGAGLADAFVATGRNILPIALRCAAQRAADQSAARASDGYCPVSIIPYGACHTCDICVPRHRSAVLAGSCAEHWRHRLNGAGRWALSE